jgi:hypothetical protein
MMKGRKDCNDRLQADGLEAVKRDYDASESYQPPKSYLSRRLSTISPVHVRWIWRKRIPRGKISLLAGQPGRGKSQLTCNMAATVSTGGTWPDGTPCDLGSVIIVQAEDDVADTIRPRLEAAGADLKRVYTLDAVRLKDREGNQTIEPFASLKRDLVALEDLINDVGDVALIIVDPISSHPGETDCHKNAEVRALLTPLKERAERTGAAIVIVTHLNKGGGDANAMARVTGSGAFVAAARSVWLFENDPADQEGLRRILTPLKNNVGDDRTGFAFKIESVTLPNSNIETSRIVFEPGTVSISAGELLLRQGEDDEARTAHTDAELFCVGYCPAIQNPQRPS